MTKKEYIETITLLNIAYDKLNKRNKQLLTALRSAKRIIKELHGEIETGITWSSFQTLPQMERINKAIKDD